VSNTATFALIKSFALNIAGKCVFVCFALCCHFLAAKTAAQDAPFFHLTTADGLADNNIRSLAIDKKGFLWIGTVEGLSMYDGYRVSSFFKGKEHLLASNNIIHLGCDAANNIWIGTPDGISWLDDKRAFHRVILLDSITRFASRTIQDTKKYGPVLYTSYGQFYRHSNTKKWEKIGWIPERLSFRGFVDAEKFTADKIIYATDSLVTVIDYNTGTACYEQPFSNVVSVCRYSDHEIAIAFRTGLVQVSDIYSKKITASYQVTKKVNTVFIDAVISEIRPAANGSILVSTSNEGLALITAAGEIRLYQHDPIIKNSIGSNDLSRVLSNPEGDVIIGSRIAGLSSFNIYNRAAGYTSIFNNGKGHFYDNFISRVAEAPGGALWLAGFEQVIRWDRKNNSTTFFPYYPETSGLSYEIRTLCIDKKGRLWTGSLGDGIAILNEPSRKFKHLPVDTAAGDARKSKVIVTLFTASDGNIWVSTVAGIYTIGAISLQTHSLTSHPVLKQIAGKRVNVFLEDKKGKMWMATNTEGIYCYDKTTGQLQHYNMAAGLASDQCFSLCQDRRQNIYVGCSMGFSIIDTNKNIISYTQKSGLRYDRCDGILEDNQGHMWISNVKLLVLFDPIVKTMQVFGQNSGISPDGFRVGSLLKTKEGELIWGSRKGINYFFPEQLADYSSKLKVSIYRADLGDSSVYITGSDSISIKYANYNIIFRFTAIDLQGSANIQYRFILDGYDKTWQEATDVRETRYSSLPAAKYNFRLMASADGINWTTAINVVSLTVIPPVWQRWWFIAAAVALLFACIALFIYKRQQKIKRQIEELETEQAISYFMSSLSEQQTEDDILWDVARNCIDRLHFEDCVIYIKDEDRDVYVQKAACGPKRINGGAINRLLEIQPGIGIVGAVAKNAKAEIINDTTKDERYLTDYMQKLSEISLPIIYNDNVLGVIDCEHSKKNFFTQKHLSILTKIASLCASKIVRARAEKEKKQAEAILTDTQRKMTEVEMHALRAQMNPHFIFNCLNSINRYIVKSDQTTASLYLTKFARLIRLILDNSNSKNVLLTNELDALKLYIEMEALRFDKKFSYEIKIDPDLSTDCIEVPPLIIQPYVENAIWHGLLHKENSGHLSIRLHITGDSLLQCVIEDDGIGRKKAKELKSKTAVSRKSLGMELTENRLSLLNKYAELHSSVQIIDLADDNGNGTGTKVVLTIPV
jgi:ligand-binding sensor domain-containing protein/GAF domain-containing protein